MSARVPWLLAVAGCFRPVPPPGAPCSDSLACPGDQVCVGGVCDGTIDAGGADAGPTKIVIGELPSQIRDTEISGSEPMLNLSTEDHDSVDADETALLWLDVSVIPAGATVLAATLTVTTSDEAALDGGTVDVFRMRASWSETEVTWLQRAIGEPWPVEGALPPARDDTPIATFRPNVLGRAFDIELPPQLIAEWIAQPADNHGIAMVRGTAELHIHLSSKESAAGIWSKLTVLVQP